MEAAVYNQSGKKVGSVGLTEAVFGARWIPDLVHQVATIMLANDRDSIAHTKTRSEVRGGGRKPWRQKGTGRARHGSSRSPIWVGGGVTHGPRKDKDYSRNLTKRMRVTALASVLSKKLAEGEVAFLDEVSLSAPKSKEARGVIGGVSKIPNFDALTKKRKNALLIAVPKKTEELARAFGNFGNIHLEEVRNLNALSLLTYRFCVIVSPEEADKLLSKRMVIEKPEPKKAAAKA